MIELEFQQKMNQRFGEEFKIIEYTDIAKPVRYLCPRCGAEKSAKSGRELFNKYALCKECYGGEGQATKAKTLEVMEKEKKCELVTWRGMKNDATVRCLKCGRLYNATPAQILRHYSYCPNCNRNGKSQEEMMQEDIDKEFGEGKFNLLSRKNNRGNIRCLACGFIFSSNIKNFIDLHKECPKCKKARSNSESLEGSTTIPDGE